MPTVITLNGTVTLDESPGAQNSGVAVPGEDNNDQDITSSTPLPPSFSTRIGQLSARAPIDQAHSASNLITVTSDTQLVSLGFSTPAGGALPVYGVATTGASSGLTALNGGAISLFQDSSTAGGLGNKVVVGVDTQGQIVFALYLDPAANFSSASIWMVQYEAMQNNLDGKDPDDAVVLSGLGVAAGSTLDFNFNSLPSGQNLFGTVGTTESGLIVIGKDAVLKSDGTYTNTSNTINTSQGGGPTTIGVNNQMFDPGDGAYFTFVKSPTPAFLAGAPGGLDQNEADDADNMLYTGGTLEVSTAFTVISQIQGNSSASMKITTFNVAGSPSGRALAVDPPANTQVAITSVKVYDATGTQVTASFTTDSTGAVTVNGLGAGYKVEWFTSGVFDQTLIEGVSGKFDIGRFGTNQAVSTPKLLDNVRFEDDGLSLAAGATPPSLTVDDSDFSVNDTKSFATQFTPTLGTDGSSSSARTYALSTLGGASGLTDTDSKQSVVLSLNSTGAIEGRTATGNDLVFKVSVDTSGNVTLDQSRAVVHASATLPDESRTLSAANLVVLTATEKDGDNDPASASLNIGQLLNFKDDAPTIGPIANSIVDFAAGQTVTKTLNGDVNNDPNAAPYTISNFDASVTVNGKVLTGVLTGAGTVVTYWDNTNGNTDVGDAGDTAYFRLTAGDQAGAGNYKFDVLVDPPPALMEFNFNSLPSGQNLFGMVGNTSTGLIVIGKDAILKSDGTYTNTSNTINTSQGGGPTTIGVNNQMFDPNDGAYFTLVKSPAPAFLAGAPGGLDQNEADDADNIQYAGGTLEVATAFTRISQIQGNSLATMKITAYNITGAPQMRDMAVDPPPTAQVGIGAVRVFDASGTQVTASYTTDSTGAVIVSGLGAGYKIEWDTVAGKLQDQVLIESVAGKFDIGAFGTNQPSPTPDVPLHFTATVTDGDTDFATATFAVGVDGTGTFHDGIVTL